MKESIQLNGKEYTFRGYRIPPDYKLPVIYGDGQHILDPEALFETEDGELFGLHPENSKLKGGENERK